MAQDQPAQSRVNTIINVAAALALATFAALVFTYLNVIWDPGRYGEFGLAVTNYGPGFYGEGSAAALHQALVAEVDPGSSAEHAGIKPGDAVDPPQTLRDRLLVSGAIAPRPGDRVTISIVRAGKRHTMTLQARPVARLSTADKGVLIFQYAECLLALVVALALVLARPSKMIWGFYLFTLLLVTVVPGGTSGPGATSSNNLAFFSYIPARWYVALSTTEAALQMAGVAGFLVFCVRFPAGAWTGWRKLIDGLAPFVFAILAGLWIATQLVYIQIAPTETYNRLETASAAAVSAVLILGCVALVTNYFAARGLERHRTKWVLVGLICAIGAFILGVLQSNGWFPTPDWLTIVLSLLYVVLPITVAYAVIRHRVIDVHFVLSRSLALGVIAAIIGLIIVGVDWLFSTRLSASRFESAVYVGIALLVGFSLNAARQRIGKTIDFLFFRPWHRAQEQADIIAQAIRLANSKAHLYEPLTAGIASVFSLASAALFERVEDGGFVRVAANAWPAGTLWHILMDDPLVMRASERPRVADIDALHWQESNLPSGVARPTVMLPIKGGGQVPALAIYGVHKNGTALDSDELRIIRRLCDDASLLYDRSPTPDWNLEAFAPSRLAYDK